MEPKVELYAEEVRALVDALDGKHSSNVVSIGTVKDKLKTFLCRIPEEIDIETFDPLAGCFRRSHEQIHEKRERVTFEMPIAYSERIMMAKHLIKILQQTVESYGDMPICVNSFCKAFSMSYCDMAQITDKDGNKSVWLMSGD